MTAYSKGRAFEYRARRRLESMGFVVFRMAGRFALDVKSQKALPRWLREALSQAHANANGKIPV